MSETTLMRRGALGDVVLLGAVTGSVQGRVTVICDSRWRGVAARLRGVDEVLDWGARGSGRTIDLQGGLRGRLTAPWARRIRKRSLTRRLRLWTGLGPRRPTVPEIYAEAVGVSVAPLPWIETTTGPGLALIPGAAWGPKQWSLARFAEVGRMWEGPVYVLGGPSESALVDALSAEVPGSIRVVESGFDDTLAALGQCRVAVAGDTGLMHLAGACGLRVVALFGPTHPDDGFWVYPGTAVQRADVRCRPCTLHRVERCWTGDHRCMDLPSQTVLEAVMSCAG